MALPLNVSIDDVDPKFLTACLNVSQSPPTSHYIPSIVSENAISSPILTALSTTDTLVSPTALTFGAIPPKVSMVDLKRLTDFYPNAFADFFGSNTPCVLKTGPEWPTNVGPESQKFIRVARPVGEHPIAPTWVPTAWGIAAKLDEYKVDWNTINPLAYANAGDAALICDFIITITVRPVSLVFAAAQAAASAVEELLEVSSVLLMLYRIRIRI